MKPYLPKRFAPFFGQRQQTLCLGTRGPLGVIQERIPIETLNSHVYVCGQTGKGKSSYLLHLAQQLIVSNQGVGLLDPHGDLVSDLIATLAAYPKRRPWLADPHNRHRVIYLDPRSEHRLPFNPLASTDHAPYVVAQHVIEAFRRTWREELTAAPRFTNIALHSLLALIANKLSLIDLARFLTHRRYREQLLHRVADRAVVDFFRERFDRWGREAPLMIESLLNKSTALTLNPYLSPMLGAAACLSLRTIMDQGKILLVNLRTPDEETRTLLGSLLMTAFEQAALARENLAPDKRKKFYLFVDEFQKFVASEGSAITLAEILSECRKYGLQLTVAHQSWAQLGAKSQLAGALEQCQVKVIFGTGRQTAEAIVKDLFLPDPQSIKHEVKDSEAQERTHPVFDPLLEQFEMCTQTIQRLRRRQVLVKLPDQDHVLTLRTPTVPTPRISRERLAAIKTELARQSAHAAAAVTPTTNARRAPVAQPAPPPAAHPTGAPATTAETAWKDALWRTHPRPAPRARVIFSHPA